MVEKRFQFDGGSNCIEFDGNSILCDNGGDLIVDELNKLQDEVDIIKHTIKEAYLSERTMLGKSVLRQLMDSIGVDDG